MKILIENGTVTAEAETIADVLALQALVGKKNYYQVQQSRRAALTKKGKRGGNTWKGKHAVACPEGDGKYKNIKLHILRTHTGKKWNMNGLVGESVSVTKHF